jgi:hypothetical protein
MASVEYGDVTLLSYGGTPIDNGTLLCDYDAPPVLGVDWGLLTEFDEPPPPPAVPFGNYLTNIIFYLPVIQNAAPFAPGKYRKGQLLGRTADGVYAAFDPNGSGGTETVHAVCVRDFTAVSGDRSPIACGEFNRDGVAAVMSALTPPVALTDQIIGQCFDVGIILN